jgi:hypothetical protein
MLASYLPVVTVYYPRRLETYVFNFSFYRMKKDLHDRCEALKLELAPTPSSIAW